MKFAAPLIEGRLLRRYKRFLADVELGDGEVVTAHCPNTGAMTTCMHEGAKVWLSEHDNPKRRLRYTWELVHTGGDLVCINSARANALVAEAIELQRIAELCGYDGVKREAKLRSGSRIDFMLSRDRERCYVEVKMVTLRAAPSVSSFPDAVSERGTRHLAELTRLRWRGQRAVLLFCSGRTHTREVLPADDIDPVYGRALRRAAAAGVEILAYSCRITPRAMWLDAPLPVRLGRAATNARARP